MYALRQSNCDCFTLCDLSTIADYAAIQSFALSETMMAIQASPLGDTIQNAIATINNAGVDSPWFKYILGDYPTWYDSFNGVSRLISPAAFGIGIYGNLSPQQSALNKPLQGKKRTLYRKQSFEVLCHEHLTRSVARLLNPAEPPKRFD
jgi:hypothetical protein